MKKLAPLILALIMVSACKTNPFTGKKTFNLYSSNDQLFASSFQQYDKFLSENNVVTGTSESEMIKRVGQKISTAAQRWFEANGQPGYLSKYKWEYKLVKDSTVNAWCMPGGKIVFYTGILPITKTETGVAVVMGHEVAHALADHGAQRMSAGIAQQLGAIGTQIAVKNKDAKTQATWMQAYGIGTTVGGMLPFSRSHETEADRIGLQIMAIAGYNPDEAANLWRRMKEKNNGKQPPEFLSTHPSNDTRIRNLTQWSQSAKDEAKKFGIYSFR